MAEPPPNTTYSAGTVRSLCGDVRADAVVAPQADRIRTKIEKEYANAFNLDDFCKRLNCSKRTLEFKAKRLLAATGHTAKYFRP